MIAEFIKCSLQTLVRATEIGFNIRRNTRFALEQGFKSSHCLFEFDPCLLQLAGLSQAFAQYLSERQLCIEE